MRILVLFSGIGGATLGIRKVFPDAEIVSVDTDPEVFAHIDDHHIVADAFKYYRTHPDWDFVWASPPCQHYSLSTSTSRSVYPDLLEATYDMLRGNTHFAIENVHTAHVYNIDPVLLWGYMFHRLSDIRRPRKFWTSFPVPKPKPLKKEWPVKRLISGHGGWLDRSKRTIRMTLDDVRKLWPDLYIPPKNSMKHAAQIVIPEYAEYIMRYFKRIYK